MATLLDDDGNEISSPGTKTLLDDNGMEQTQSAPAFAPAQRPSIGSFAPVARPQQQPQQPSSNVSTPVTAATQPTSIAAQGTSFRDLQAKAAKVGYSGLTTSEKAILDSSLAAVKIKYPAAFDNISNVHKQLDTEAGVDWLSTIGKSVRAVSSVPAAVVESGAAGIGGLVGGSSGEKLDQAAQQSFDTFKDAMTRGISGRTDGWAEDMAMDPATFAGLLPSGAVAKTVGLVPKYGEAAANWMGKTAAGNIISSGLTGAGLAAASEALNPAKSMDVDPIIMGGLVGTGIGTAVQGLRSMGIRNFPGQGPQEKMARKQSGVEQVLSPADREQILDELVGTSGSGRVFPDFGPVGYSEAGERLRDKALQSMDPALAEAQANYMGRGTGSDVPLAMTPSDIGNLAYNRTIRANGLGDATNSTYTIPELVKQSEHLRDLTATPYQGYAAKAKEYLKANPDALSKGFGDPFLLQRATDVPGSLKQLFNAAGDKAEKAAEMYDPRQYTAAVLQARHPETPTNPGISRGSTTMQTYPEMSELFPANRGDITDPAQAWITPQATVKIRGLLNRDIYNRASSDNANSARAAAMQAKESLSDYLDKWGYQDALQRLDPTAAHTYGLSKTLESQIAHTGERGQPMRFNLGIVSPYLFDKSISNYSKPAGAWSLAKGLSNYGPGLGLILSRYLESDKEPGARY